MTAGINHQDVFMCPVALLPYNVTQVKPKYRNNLLTLNTPSFLSSNLSQRKAGGAQGEMETIQLLKLQPMIDLEFSTPARCVRRAKVFRANFFRAKFFSNTLNLHCNSYSCLPLSLTLHQAVSLGFHHCRQRYSPGQQLRIRHLQALLFHHGGIARGF
jgi:hypothetical protein